MPHDRDLLRADAGDLSRRDPPGVDLSDDPLDSFPSENPPAPRQERGWPSGLLRQPGPEPGRPAGDAPTGQPGSLLFGGRPAEEAQEEDQLGRLVEDIRRRAQQRSGDSALPVIGRAAHALRNGWASSLPYLRDHAAFAAALELIRRLRSSRAGVASAASVVALVLTAVVVWRIGTTTQATTNPAPVEVRAATLSGDAAAPEADAAPPTTQQPAPAAGASVERTTATRSAGPALPQARAAGAAGAPVSGPSGIAPPPAAARTASATPNAARGPAPQAAPVAANQALVPPPEPAPLAFGALFSSADADVRPPRLINGDLPRPAIQGLPTRTNSMELIISEAGSVERVRLLTNQRMPDMMILSRAKMWQFEPALRNGQPVRYRLVLSWEYNP